MRDEENGFEMDGAESESDPDAFEAVLSEFVARIRGGEKPSVDHYIREHPDLADRIRELFPGVLALEGAQPAAAGESGENEAEPVHRIGDFRILREIGRGGMGVVHEAIQESLNRHVALKVLPLHHLLDKRQLDRFQREARAAASLEHPNIVPVYGIGQDDGFHYYAMQFIPGESLAEVLMELKALRSADSAAEVHASDLARHPSRHAASGHALPSGAAESSHGSLSETTELGVEPPFDFPADIGRPTSSDTSSSVLSGGSSSSLTGDYFHNVARIGLQAARALAYAHDHGVIHRDVKPSNLLLDSTARLWITDFGLAKPEGDEDITHAGEVVGTFCYLPPEALEGWSDPRGDIYGLGLTLYELLTLRRAFEERDRRKLVRQIAEDEPPRPRRIDSTIPRDLESIVLKAIEKEPRDRYQNAGQMAEDLLCFIEDRPIVSRPAAVSERLWRWCRRNRELSLSVAGSLVLLILGLVAVLIVQARAHRELRKERDRVVRAMENEARAVRARELALSDLHAESGLHAGDIGQYAQAALRFAHAARMAGEDAKREVTNRIRFRNWSRRAAAPILALPHGGERPRHLRFHPGGRYLGVLTSGPTCAVWDLVRGERLDLPGGERPVTSFAWSPDGRVLALGSPGGELSTYEFPSGLFLGGAKFVGGVEALAFSLDGRLLAAGSSRVRVFTSDQLAPVSPEWLHPAPVYSLVFSPTGTRLASAAWDRRVRVFAVGEGAAVEGPLFPPVVHIQGWPESECEPKAPVFVDGGARIVTQTGDRQMTWYDVETGAERDSRFFDGVMIHSVALSPDGRSLAVAGNHGFELWDLRERRKLYDRREHATYIRHVAFSADGTRLITGSEDRTAGLWSTEDGERLGSFLPHQREVVLAAFAPSGPAWATAQRDGLVRVWIPPRPAPLARHLEIEGSGTFVSLSPDGRYVLSTGGGWGSTVTSATVYRAETLEPAAPPLRIGGVLRDFELTRDGTIGVTVDSWNRLKLWDWRRGLPLGELTTPSEPLSVAFSPDGKTCAVVASGGEVLVVDVGRAEVIQRFQHGSGKEGEITAPDCIQFSPDGRVLATAGIDSNVCVWDYRKGELAFPPCRLDGFCRLVLFSPDGRVVFATGQGGDARLWDTRSGAPVGRVLEHPNWVMAAAFSPDGELVVTGDRDGVARVWDWRQGELVGPPLRHASEVHGVGWMPSGDWVVTSSRDRTAGIWDPSTGKLIAPPLELSYWGKGVIVTPESRAVVVSGLGGHIEAFEVSDLIESEQRLSRDDLVLWGEILSGQRVDDRGGVTGSNRDEWLESWRAFRTRHPDYPLDERERSRLLTEDHGRDLHLEAQAGLAPSSSRAESDNVVAGIETAGVPGGVSTFAAIEDALRSLDEEVVIRDGAEWKYREGTREPSAEPLAWTRLEFDDSRWKEDRSGFGFDSGKDLDPSVRTVLDMRMKYLSLYLRRRFSLTDPDLYREFRLSVRVDDGCVLYLNGEEIGRVHVDVDADVIPHDALALDAPEPIRPVVWRLDPSALKPGENVLAIQGMNRGLSSSDFLLAPVLYGVRRPSAARDGQLLASLRAAVGHGGDALIGYLEARSLQRAGDHRRAIERFREVIEKHRDQPEPFIRCGDSLRALGDAAAAEEAYRDILERGLSRDADVWSRWLEVCFVDLNLGIEQVLERFRRITGGVSEPAGGTTDDVRWLLGHLARHEPLRINCGGETTIVSGTSWSRDRFFDGGIVARLDRPVDVENAEDDILYFSERYFPDVGVAPRRYRVPVPPARYRVTLHIVEVFLAPGQRRFDFSIEGQRVNDYEPPVQRLERELVDVAVRDGFLDIEFFHGRLNFPKVSAIEIEWLGPVE